MMIYYSVVYTVVWLYRCEKIFIIKGISFFLCGKLAQADFNLQIDYIKKFFFHMGQFSSFKDLNGITSNF